MIAMLELLKIAPRFFVWIVAFVINMVIHFGDRFARWITCHDKRAHYLRKGACRQSGVCCEAIGIKVPAFWLRHPWIIKIWNQIDLYVHNFHYEGLSEDNMLVYTCAFFKDRKCSIHPFRPKLCREYPATTLLGHASVQKGCGFKFVKKHKMFQDELDLKTDAIKKSPFRA